MRRSIVDERERIAERSERSSGMCSKFIPQIEAKNVRQRDDRRPGRDACTTWFWRTLISARFASRIEVRSSRWAMTCSSTRLA